MELITQEMTDKAFQLVNQIYKSNLNESNLDNPYVRGWFARAIEKLYNIDMPDVPTLEEIKTMKK